MNHILRMKYAPWVVIVFCVYVSLKLLHQAIVFTLIIMPLLERGMFSVVISEFWFPLVIHLGFIILSNFLAKNSMQVLGMLLRAG